MLSGPLHSDKCKRCKDLRIEIRNRERLMAQAFGRSDRNYDNHARKIAILRDRLIAHLQPSKEL